MRSRLLMISFAAIALGCKSDPPALPQPLDIDGTVTLNGKPVGNVRLVLNAGSEGVSTGNAEVSADGKFTAKLRPGKYLYVVEQISGKSAPFKAIPEKYHSVNGEHMVEVPPTGGSIEIALK